MNTPMSLRRKWIFRGRAFCFGGMGISVIGSLLIQGLMGLFLGFLRIVAVILGMIVLVISSDPESSFKDEDVDR